MCVPKKKENLNRYILIVTQQQRYRLKSSFLRILQLCITQTKAIRGHRAHIRRIKVDRTNK